jgi:peptidoglycan hydrolase CwlO-like protein
VQSASLETQSSRPKAVRYLTMRTVLLVVAFATTVSVVLWPLDHHASASSATSLQQRANVISEQLVQAQLEVDGYQQQYSVATARVTADQKAIAGIQAKITSDKTAITEGTHAVRHLALLAYVYNGGASASSEAGLFSENVKTAQAANEYVNISVGDLDEAVANLHTDQKAVVAQQATLMQQQSEDRSTQARQANYLGQATATSQTLSNLQAQVTGQLASAVALANQARATAAQKAVATATATAQRSSGATQASASDGSDPALNKFLLCVRNDESRGNYQAVSPNGLYRGAFQFSQPTWNYAAQAAGRPDLVGVPPNTASRAAQDTVAVTLYSLDGERPWLGDRCNANGAY